MASGKNLAYNKGARKERGFVLWAKRMGYPATRSAGSRGLVDVIIFNTDKKIVQCIQCKPESISHAEREKLIREAEDSGLKGEGWKVEFGVD